MDRLLTLAYYFTPRPDPNFQYTKFTIIVIALLFFGSLAIREYRRRVMKDEMKKKIFRPIPGLFQLFAFLLLLLLFFRESGLPYLSMRFLWVLWGLFLIILCLRSLLRGSHDYKIRLKQHHLHSSQWQYLPKKKKH